MLKIKSVLKGIILLISFIACSQKENYFKGEIIIVPDIPVTDTLIGEKLTLDSINSGILSFCDTMLFFMSHRTPDYHYRCFNSQGRYIADYFPKGRGYEEFFGITPIIQKYKENGEWKALFTAINEEKAGIFNITKSIQEKKTVCDTIFPFKWSKISNRPFISIFQYDTTNILAYKQSEVQSPQEKKFTLPQWVLIDSHTGEVNKTYDLFEKEIYIPGAEEFNASIYSSINLLNSTRTQLVMLWELIPQINILNLETGKFTGYRIAGMPDLNDLQKQGDDLKQYHGFSDIDDQYIYALYADQSFSHRQENKDCTIYVFDWNGQLLHKLYLKEGIDQIQVDAQKRILYGANIQMEEIYRYQLPF